MGFLTKPMRSDRSAPPFWKIKTNVEVTEYITTPVHPGRTAPAWEVPKLLARQVGHLVPERLGAR